MITTTDYTNWLTSARPGDKIVYYTGFLGEDRIILDPEAATEDDWEIGRVADAVLRTAGYRRAYKADHDAQGLLNWARDDGEPFVHLVQRRLGRRRFEYIAVRR